MLHEVALGLCQSFEEADYGRGPAKVYHFADGSALINDDRGYTVSRPDEPGQ
jgi:hypothetical protein